MERLLWGVVRWEHLIWQWSKLEVSINYFKSDSSIKHDPLRVVQDFEILS